LGLLFFFCCKKTGKNLAEKHFFSTFAPNNKREDMLRLLKIAAPLLALLLAFTACSDNGDIPDPDDPNELPWNKEPESDAVRDGLPTLRINTPDGRDVDSKDNYVMKCEALLTREDGGRDLYGLAAVKGRGNTTWPPPKKPYALHFHSAQSVLGRPKANTWTLLANYHDTTLIRNDIAYYMGRTMSRLDFTPDPAFVYLHMNGQYRGIYQICEKINVGSNRVQVGDDGFLLEIDSKTEAGEITFPVAHLDPGVQISIKEPEEITVGDDNYNYIRDYVTAFEEALFSDDFLDPEKGYAKYIDEDSFVEWYLVNEIAKNHDAGLWSSCYMSLRRGGKLKMGPLWDFDVAFGGYWPTEEGINVINNPTGFHIKEASWFRRLFMSPAFVAKVRNRFADYFRNRQLIYDRIDTSAALVKPLIYNENRLYARLCDPQQPKQIVEERYDVLVKKLKIWIEARMLWLNENIGEL
jgi:hypothetical protein